MKDIHEVLRQKELECARVQAEIDALRMVIPLLEGEALPESNVRSPSEHAGESASTAEHTGTEGPTFSSVGQSESSFWKRRR